MTLFAGFFANYHTGGNTYYNNAGFKNGQDFNMLGLNMVNKSLFRNSLALGPTPTANMTGTDAKNNSWNSMAEVSGGGSANPNDGGNANAAGNATSGSPGSAGTTNQAGDAPASSAGSLASANGGSASTVAGGALRADTPVNNSSARGEDAGCGCRTGKRSGSAPLLPLAVGLAFVALRRRGRR